MKRGGPGETWRAKTPGELKKTQKNTKKKRIKVIFHPRQVKLLFFVTEMQKLIVPEKTIFHSENFCSSENIVNIPKIFSIFSEFFPS